MSNMYMYMLHVLQCVAIRCACAYKCMCAIRAFEDLECVCMYVLQCFLLREHIHIFISVAACPHPRISNVCF